MAKSALEVQRDIARDIAIRAQLTVGRAIESRTLRAALERTRVEDTDSKTVESILTVPHYWAVYYHDGRGPIVAKRGKFLVWFRSIDDDPRVASGHPVRATDIRKLRLSKTEFRRLHKAGKLIIAKRSGSVTGRPFFKTIANLSSNVGDITVPAIDQLILDGLREDGTLRVRDTIEIVLG